MCKTKNIDCEITNSDHRIYNFDYNILILNQRYFDPTIFPTHIKVIYGPQFWVFPSGPLVGTCDSKYAKKCVYNCLSKWVEHIFFEMTRVGLKIPIVQFPFAIDIDRFKSENIPKSIDCLVYVKRRSPKDIEIVLSHLRSSGYIYKMFTYGSYHEHDYLYDLQRTKCMIVLDAHESQGYALQEAMSCNVPLFVCDVSSMYDEIENGRSNYAHYAPKKLLATSVPYWSEKCGERITSLDAFGDFFDNFFKHSLSYTPREFVLSELSPEICMDRILEYFDITLPIPSPIPA